MNNVYKEKKRNYGMYKKRRGKKRHLQETQSEKRIKKEKCERKVLTFESKKKERL